MGRQNKDKAGAKKKDKKEAPKPKFKKGERKRCKSPRGVKLEKTVNRMIGEVDLPTRRHRNDYNARTAKVRKLASLLA